MNVQPYAYSPLAQEENQDPNLSLDWKWALVHPAKEGNTQAIPDLFNAMVERGCMDLSFQAHTVTQAVENNRLDFILALFKKMKENHASWVPTLCNHGLVQAAMHGQLRICKVLLNQQATEKKELKEAFESRVWALEEAAQAGFEEIVQYLLNCNRKFPPKFQLLKKHQEKALEKAFAQRRPSAIRLLCQLLQIGPDKRIKMLQKLMKSKSSSPEISKREKTIICILSEETLSARDLQKLQAPPLISTK